MVSVRVEDDTPLAGKEDHDIGKSNIYIKT